MNDPAHLPFSRSNPFIWDNDANHDVFTLEFVMALANNGVIRLVGITQSPHPYRTRCEDLQAIVEKARAVGWKNIPDAAWNLGDCYATALIRPDSGRIEDTLPIETRSAEFILECVLGEGTPAVPVVIGAGGPLTSVVSAYLMALRQGRGDEFAKKVIVLANLGLIKDGRPTISNYNPSQDEWATYICLERLRNVIVDNKPGHTPQIWEFVKALPGNVLTEYMWWKQGEQWPYPTDHSDIDANVVLAFLFPRLGDYFRKLVRVRVAGWNPRPAGWDHPSFKYNVNAYHAELAIEESPEGGAVYVSDFSQSVSDETWKREVGRAMGVGQ
jgi:hypothetical protein